MDLGLKDKVAMVAGASRGLGYAVARGLAAEGVKVSMGSRDAGKIADAGRRIAGETYAETLAVELDVRSRASIEAWQRTIERFGGVDLLFVNTGGPPAGARCPSRTCVAGGVRVAGPSAVRWSGAVPSMKARGGGAMSRRPRR